ncbi:family 1 glycosylhydrolase, partial [Vibrio sp. 404]|nr:family 1 glycosylhydrolase [Vibrio marinisediminis]
YYTRKIIGPGDSPWPAYREIDGPLPKTQMGWEVFPEGLHALLTMMQARFTGDLPIYITENGMASALTGNDADR